MQNLQMRSVHSVRQVHESSYVASVVMRTSSEYPSISATPSSRHIVTLLITRAIGRSWETSGGAE